MRTLRHLTVGIAAVAVVASASAQFDGPAPLAWRWVQPTNATATSAPLVDGDNIYTAIGGRVFAIDRATGNLKWRYPAIDPIDGTFRSTPVLIDGVLIVAGDNKTIYGIDPAKGSAKWTYNSPVSIIGQPVAAGKFFAYSSSDNKLNVVDAATGAAGWKQPYNIYDGVQGQISSYNGGIVYFTGKNEMRSIDVVSQRANYARPTKFGSLPPGAVPVLFGDTFYISSGPFLVAVNASNGIAKWQKSIGLQLAYAPAVSQSGILVVSVDGKALVLDLLSGSPTAAMKKGPVELGSSPAVRPTPAGTKFVVPTSNGAVNLFDPKTGELLWSYVVRPIGEIYEGGSQGGNQGGPGMGGPGMGGGMGMGGNQNAGRRLITTLAASGPAILAGETLLVPARDGSILAFDKNLGVDLTPPTVKQLWPNPGDVVSGRPPLELIFRLEDEAAGINEKSLKVEVDGQVYDHKYTRDGLLRVAFSMLSGNNKPLDNGRHSVVVTATDWLGNTIKSTYSIVIDNALAPLQLPNGTNNNQGGPGGPGGRGGMGGGGMGGDGR